MKVHCLLFYPVPDRSWDGVLFSNDFFVCIFLPFFVSLLARLRENGWTDLHEIFREGAEWPWDDLITFLVNSEKSRDAAMRKTGTGFAVLSHHNFYCSCALPRILIVCIIACLLNIGQDWTFCPVLQLLWLMNVSLHWLLRDCYCYVSLQSSDSRHVKANSFIIIIIIIIRILCSCVSSPLWRLSEKTSRPVNICCK